MKVVVLGGGESPERVTSLNSARAVSAALRRKGHRVFFLDPSSVTFVTRLQRLKPDCVFIALHGGKGEGGAIQGFLEILNLPYTGSGVTASALCLNKLRTKEILLFHGLPTPPYVSLPRGSFPSKLPFDFPVVVKPNSLGSTIGISIVKEKKHLAAAVEKAFSHDSEVFIEKYISGVEVTVSLLGNDPPAVLPMIQIETASGFYDYKAKYTPGASRHRIPPELPEKARKKAARVSLKAYLILGCRDLARIDLMVDRDGHPWILDVNTIPGFTRTSLVPDAARAAGIEFDELCDRLIALAISRQCRQ